MITDVVSRLAIGADGRDVTLALRRDNSGPEADQLDITV